MLALLVSQSGCTYALWTNGNLDAYREPMPDPSLHLYESRQSNDVLVVYQEISERNDAIRTREYWLNKNEKRIDNLHQPIFVSKKSARQLSPIPVYDSMPKDVGSKQGFYAVCETNQPAFTLYSGQQEIGDYKLPVYNDRWGYVEKTALTPITTSVDLTIVGGWIGILYLYSRAGEPVPLLPPQFWNN